MLSGLNHECHILFIWNKKIYFYNIKNSLIHFGVKRENKIKLKVRTIDSVGFYLSLLDKRLDNQCDTVFNYSHWFALFLNLILGLGC